MSAWFVNVDVDFDNLAEVVFVRFFFYTLFHLPFYTVVFGRKSQCTAHT